MQFSNIRTLDSDLKKKTSVSAFSLAFSKRWDNFKTNLFHSSVKEIVKVRGARQNFSNTNQNTLTFSSVSK